MCECDRGQARSRSLLDTLPHSGSGGLRDGPPGDALAGGRPPPTVGSEPKARLGALVDSMVGCGVLAVRVTDRSVGVAVEAGLAQTVAPGRRPASTEPQRSGASEPAWSFLRHRCDIATAGSGPSLEAQGSQPLCTGGDGDAPG